MKFRNLVFIFIIAILLVAWFTKPGREAFQKFLASEKISSPPLIEEADGVIYSMYTVSYFGVKEIAPTDSSTKKIAVPLRKEKFLGLFGKFWKLD